jgi:hypothetical protein
MEPLAIVLNPLLLKRIVGIFIQPTLTEFSQLTMIKDIQKQADVKIEELKKETRKQLKNNPKFKLDIIAHSPNIIIPEVCNINVLLLSNINALLLSNINVLLLTI